MTIEIYGAPWCGYCRQAKAHCERLGVDYVYYDLDEKPELKDTLSERLGFTVQTIPQIFIDDELVDGGYNGLIKVIK